MWSFSVVPSAIFVETSSDGSLARRQKSKPKPLSDGSEQPLDFSVEARAVDLTFDNAAWFDALFELLSELAAMIRDDEPGLAERLDRGTHETDHVA